MFTVAKPIDSIVLCRCCQRDLQCSSCSSGVHASDLSTGLPSVPCRSKRLLSTCRRGNCRALRQREGSQGALRRPRSFQHHALLFGCRNVGRQSCASSQRLGMLGQGASLLLATLTCSNGVPSVRFPAFQDLPSETVHLPSINRGLLLQNCQNSLAYAERLHQHCSLQRGLLRMWMTVRGSNVVSSKPVRRKVAHRGVQSAC